MSSQLYKRLARDVMSRTLVTVNARDAVHDALELMIENKVSALPVLDHDGRCVGILSTRDFVDVAYELDESLSALEHESELWWGTFVRNLSQHVGQRSVMELMTEDVVSVGPETLLVQAASKMLQERVHRLPVVDAQGRLLGIISMSDVLRAFVECTPQA
ncbi:MAG: CBS domain-containing protein [Planctomycetota bacterium]|nr:CBS domain-containing protein [Planctomycetota bacterium]